MPPVIVVGVLNADAYIDALYHQPFAKRVRRFISFMKGISETSLSLRETDDDGRNRRLFAWDIPHHVSDGTLTSMLACALHQNNMLEGTTITTIGRHLIDGIRGGAFHVPAPNVWPRDSFRIPFGFLFGSECR